MLTIGDLNVDQHERLSIIVELAAEPALLLFLSEVYPNIFDIASLTSPYRRTYSGLDSQTAWSICMLLRKLASNGMAILCTIHQLSASLFQTFDQLLLVGRVGKPLYFGDIGSDATIVKE